MTAKLTTRIKSQPKLIKDAVMNWRTHRTIKPGLKMTLTEEPQTKGTFAAAKAREGMINCTHNSLPFK